MTIIELFIMVSVILGVVLFVHISSRKTLKITFGVLTLITLTLIPVAFCFEEYSRAIRFVILTAINGFGYFRYRDLTTPESQQKGLAKPLKNIRRTRNGIK